ncbi:MAG: hypothetical protein ACHQAZ_09225, partial [Gammaproteobacteria bacterium]
MKLGACLGVLLCCSLPLAAYADDAPPPPPAEQGVLDDVSEYLKGQSIQLGLSYSQGTFKMSKGNTQSQLTDNGRATAIIDYTSPEHVLGKFPMKYGDAVLGINLSGTFGQQHT